jgi:DNA-binding IclR family transcriptional regulator
MPEKFLQSVDNALRILELFSGNVQELGVSDVSRMLGLGRSTAHRLLSTLENRGFVEQNPNTGKYKLGIKIVNIGANLLGKLNLIKECRPYLEQVSNKTGETCHLALYSQGEITFVDKVQGKNPANMASTIGLKRPAHITATGKSILAYLPEKDFEKYLCSTELQQYTPATITVRGEFREHIQKIKEQGYSEDQQESEEGLVCMGAPIRDATGKVVAAMSVSGAVSRMDSRKEEMVRVIKEAADQASRACGWSPHYEWK